MSRLSLCPALSLRNRTSAFHEGTASRLKPSPLSRAYPGAGSQECSEGSFWPAFPRFGTHSHSTSAYTLQNLRLDWNPSFGGGVRATAVGQDAEWGVERNAVLAGDPKGLDYYVILIEDMDIPSRGSEEERIRIPCRYELIYRVMDIINKTELCKYVSVRVRY